MSGRVGIHARNRVDIPLGSTFGYYTVIAATSNSAQHEAKWLCRCICGVERALASHDLRSGHSKSCGCKKTKPACVTEPRHRYSVYKKQAKIRGLDFTLPIRIFDALIQGVCRYCGTPPSTPAKSRHPRETNVFYWNGIDRVDNSLGYTPNNCVTCCSTCNRAKRSMPVEEFNIWLKRVAAHQAAQGMK